MAYEQNTETQKSLKREIKALQSRCVDTCHMLENAPLDIYQITPDNVVEKKLHYIEGLRTELENSNTSIVTDENLLTSQFLSEIKQKASEVEELIAFTRGSIHNVDKEINRLNTLTKMSHEAISRPIVQKEDVQPEHLQKAKEKFNMMKNELHGLIESLFPSNSEMITDFLGQLMMEKLNESSTGYMAITSENYQLVEFMKDINLVKVNPYNKMEVKLAY